MIAGVASDAAAEEAEPVVSDGAPPFKTLPSLSLQSSAPTPVTPASSLLPVLPTSRLHDLVRRALVGVPVAYSSPSTPPRPPVLPRSGSITAAAVRRVQNPSSSKVKLSASGGAKYGAESTPEGRGRGPMSPVRIPVALRETERQSECLDQR